MQPSVTDWLVAISTMAYTLLTLGLLCAALVAWRTAKAALRASEDASRAAQEAARAAKEANEQASQDSIRRTRPYVFVELLPGLQGIGCYDLRIANAGKSAAKHLTLHIETWPSPADDVVSSIERLFRHERTLPPGCSIRTVWRIEGTFTDGTSVAGMLPHATVTVKYTSDDPSNPNYSDTFEISASDSGLWPVPEDGADPTTLNGDARKFYLLGQALVRRIGELAR
jgi:hypothetical protein